MVFTRRDKNAACLRSFEKMLGRFLPDTLVLEVFDRRTSIKSHRVSNLCRAIVALAVDRGVEVAVYSRGDVRTCFSSVGARTRDEIAEAVARHIEAFRHLLPRKRTMWESEDRRLAVFTAAALVLTHYQLGASRFLDDLGGIQSPKP
jgi:Holliday junction resolvasome RuvABC endonuclease subunit